MAFHNHQEEIDAAVTNPPSALEELFGAPGPVLLNVESLRYEGMRADFTFGTIWTRVVEAFTGAGAARAAYRDAEDGDAPSYPKAHHVGCIELLPDGTWRKVSLFRGGL